MAFGGACPSTLSFTSSISVTMLSSTSFSASVTITYSNRAQSVAAGYSSCVSAAVTASVSHLSIYWQSVLTTLKIVDTITVSAQAPTIVYMCAPGEVSVQNICYPCSTGSYLTGQSCSVCPLNSYSAMPAATACTQCPSGMVTLSTASRSSSACLQSCAAGTFSQTGAAPCNQCPPNTYSNSGATGCTACGQGLGNGMSGSSSCYSMCPNGTYSPTGYSMSGCSACPLNSYQSTPGATACTACPSGTITSTTGANSSSQCVTQNVCATMLCQNGGQCVGFGSVGQCKCAPGYTGTNCGSLINMCQNSPCANGGGCTSNGGVSYTCSCLPAWTGAQCSVKVNFCQNVSCGNGVCVPNDSGYTCKCSPGYTGSNCSQLVEYCTPNPCQNGGNCSNVLGGFQCTNCAPGYTGQTCNVQIDMCKQLQPCGPGATCYSLNNSYTCSCATGYTGQNCSTPIDYCQNNLCANGSTCLNGKTGYQCICQPGYAQPYCDQVINVCTATSCMNGGACSPAGVGQFQCSCPVQYSGPQCATYNSICSSIKPCMNGANCMDIPSNYSYSCSCTAAWSGQNCTAPVNLCTSTYCSNGGNCSMSNGVATCQCPTGYQGPTCAEQINYCLSSPCANGANCSLTPGSYQCQCANGWTGPQCMQMIDYCTSSSCANGGKCNPTLGNFTCTCPAGFFGPTCSSSATINACLSSPCLNNGTCVSNASYASGYMCTCAPYFSGTTCQTYTSPCLSNTTNGCINGTCNDLRGSYSCSCYEGYTGALCNQPINWCGNTSISSQCVSGSCVNNGPSWYCACNPGYTGTYCNSFTSQAFDLQINQVVVNAAFSYSYGPFYSTSAVPQFSLMTWVQYTTASSTGSYFSWMYGANVLIVMSTSVTFYVGGTSFNFALTVNDGNLHNVIITYSANTVTVYQDGTSVGSQKIQLGGYMLPNVQQMTIVGSVNSTALMSTAGNVQTQCFTGTISRSNIFSLVLSSAQILQLQTITAADNVATPLFQVASNFLFFWTSFYSVQVSGGYMTSQVPSTVGQATTCPPGFTNPPACNVTYNKAPPSISCPSDTFVYTSTRVTTMSWSQVSYTSSNQISSVSSSYTVGQLVSYGTYTVVSTVADVAGNLATCSFNYVVQPQPCPIPQPPANGAYNCSMSDGVTYCTLSCNVVNGNQYVLQGNAPPSYSCADNGQWLPAIPPLPNRFPSCQRSLPATSLPSCVSGTITISLSASASSVAQLQSKFMDMLNGIPGLCPSGGCSSQYVSTFISGSSSGRRKRQGGTGTVAFVVPTSNSSGTVTSSALNSAFNGSATLAPSTTNCAPGYIVDTSTSGNCNPCPAGTYYVSPSNSSSSATCQPCPIGQYQTNETQFSCTQCPSGMTTASTGNVYSTDCYMNCNPGYYYNNATGSCSSCGYGFYNSLSGQTSCSACVAGLTTNSTTTTGNASACYNPCVAGQQLASNNTCVLCVAGTWSSSNTSVCQSCPSRTTTPSAGSTSSSQCTQLSCLAGEYAFTSGGTTQCLPCAFGFYQPNAGQSSCLPCTGGTTSFVLGSTSSSSCVPGSCAAGFNNCLQTYGQCVTGNASVPYTCSCITGYYGDGVTNCSLCSSLCFNGATCSMVSGSVQCNCASGYSGTQCQTAVTTTPATGLSQTTTLGIAIGVPLGVVALVAIAAVAYYIKTGEAHKAERANARARTDASAAKYEMPVPIQVEPPPTYQLPRLQTGNVNSVYIDDTVNIGPGSSGNNVHIIAPMHGGQSTPM